MTESALRICRELASRYPTSAAASGGALLRLSVDKAFPYVARSRPDAKDSFLDAAEHLERERLVTLSWKRFREGEELASITLVNPKSLFASLGQPFPPDEAQNARTAALVAANEMSARHATASYSSFFLWMTDNIKPADTVIDAAGANGSLPLAAIISDLGRLMDAFPGCIRDGVLSGITLRALSIQLFSDSKRIESLLRELGPLLNRARRAGITVSDLSALERNYPDSLVSGSLVFIMDDGSRIQNIAGTMLGLPLPTARRISRIEPGSHSDSGTPARLLTVENLETFYALAAGRDAVLADAFLYSGGHPNRAVQLLVAAFSRSGFSITHAGDLDPDGILILQELSDCAGAEILPLRMDALTFDAYLGYARNLDAQSIKRAGAIRGDTLSISGIEALLARILTTNMGVEQEIIRY